MKISIIGAGYVGLATGVGLASKGHQVFAVDVDKVKVEKINKGISPIYEKGLEELLKKVLQKKIFTATTDLKKAIEHTDVTFIAVSTPAKKSGHIDLSYVKKASQQIGSELLHKKGYHTVVVKSTVTPQTTLKVVLPLIEQYSKKRAGKDFGLCMNPEFLKESSALEDFLHPDRIVIGQIDKKSGDNLARVYKVFTTDIIRTSLNNAEMIKYASNALFATLVSFSNEIANIAERIEGANAFEILQGLYFDKRLNPIVHGKRINPGVLSYLYPGCGFGGSCFPKDLQALVSFSKSKGHNPSLLVAVLDTNKKQPLRLVSLAEQKLGNLKNKNIAILGLAFKPETDDTRESPAIKIIKELMLKKAHVVAFDPVVKSRLANLNFEVAKSLQKAVKNKDACFIVTNWKEFKKLTPAFIKKELPNHLFIDGRGFFNNKEYKGKINYLGIGLGKKKFES